MIHPSTFFFFTYKKVKKGHIFLMICDFSRSTSSIWSSTLFLPLGLFIHSMTLY